MMRYQGLSPDNLPLSNGKRSHWRTCKDDGVIGSREIEEDDAAKTIPNFVEGHKGVPRFRSPSPKDQNFSPYTSNGGVPNSVSKNSHQQHEMNNSGSPIHNGGGSGGDVLLQWGHRKRSRISRSIGPAAVAAGPIDDSSSSSSTQIQAMMKVQRRSVSLPTPATAPAGPVETKNATNTNVMPPPSSMVPTTISVTTTAAVATTSTSNGKGGNLKSCSKDTSAFSNRRSLEERSGGGNGSQQPRNGGGGRAAVAGGGAASSSRSKVGKRSPSKVIEKHDHHKKSISSSSGSASLKVDEKSNGLIQQEQEGIGGGGIAMNQHQNIGSGPTQEVGCSTNTTNHHIHHHDGNTASKNATVAAEKAANGSGGGEVNEWPRVYIPLTRKEKEEDFLVMKGTKLPHRPKKRPKAVDRMLQYCFPGMWLSDVTKARYEVKEKKCTTKKPKRRGLKGMESMDSDSE